jgi:hypothetical protein
MLRVKKWKSCQDAYATFGKLFNVVARMTAPSEEMLRI